jgi:type I pantothenate kinase
MGSDDRYHDLAKAIRRRLPAPGRPLLVGISGPVAVGKSTTATILEKLLGDDGVGVDVLCTDCFLHPNAVLAARNLTMRKGYPESFDTHTMERCLVQVRRGEMPVRVPIYSHTVYDTVPGATKPIGPAEVVVIEGVNVLQRPAIDYLDLSIYVDADEGDVRRWFVDRFLALCAVADAGERSFYDMFADLDDEQRRAVAESAWDSINGPNVRDHIVPGRSQATFVVRKAADHAVIAITGPMERG